MICIYSHATGFDKITQIVQSHFPKGKLSVGKQQGSDFLELEIKGGLFKASSSIRIQYRQKENDNSDLTNNIKGLYGYVSTLPCSNEKVKASFLQKISTLNCEFVISQQQGETKDFLDKNLDLIVDQQGNCEIDSLDVEVAASTLDAPQADIMDDQVARKARSEKIIESKNIPVLKSLPYIESEDELEMRTPKEIAQRATVLAITNLVAFNQMTGKEATDYLHHYNLWAFVTPGEKEFLANPTEERKNNETWKCEGIWTLLWATKKVDDLPFPDELCNLGNVPPGNYPIAMDKDPNEYIDAVAGIRTKAEILDANDLYYRLDWACVDARINGRQMTTVHPGVVYERHYALNWLVRYMDQEWDDVSCDT